MTTIYHIRRRARRRGGNQWYLDRSERPTSTFCGAPVTEYDAAWADRRGVCAFTHAGREFAPCVACQAAVAASLKQD